MRFNFFLFISCFLVFSSHGQTVHRFRVETQYGLIIPHASDLKSVSGNTPLGFAVAWQFMNTSREGWDVCNCFNYLGLQASYHDFGDSEVLGGAYTLAGTFEPVIWRGPRMSLTLNTGIGISYMTRIHHPETNPLNNFFSAHVSFLMFVAPALEYRFADNWGARLSVNYNHISNGGQKQPNKGMNFPQAGVGIQYYFQSPKELPVYPRNLSEPKWHYWLEAGVTTHKVEGGDSRKPSVSFVGGVYKPVSFLNAFGAGVESTIDMSVKKQEGGHIVLAPFVSHHFLLGRFDFSQRIAYYAVKPEFIQKQFYQRYVLFYTPVLAFRMGISLKAHGHVASNLDFRLGWSF